MKFEYRGKQYDVDPIYTWVGIDASGEIWVYAGEATLCDPGANEYWDCASHIQEHINTVPYSGSAECQPIIPLLKKDVETITIQIPAHLKDWFIGMMSGCVEQTFMDCYHNHDDVTEDDYVSFDYPYFDRKYGRPTEETVDIIITEGNENA